MGQKTILGDVEVTGTLTNNGQSVGFDPAEIPEGDILQNAVLGLNEDDELVKGDLFGKYVRISEAFESNTLTDEQINMLKDGVFMKGKFLGLHNPVFFPCQLNNWQNRYGGVVLSFFMNQNVGIYMYEIVVSSKKISVTPFITKNIGQSYLTSIPGAFALGDGTSAASTINGSKWPKERVPQTNNSRIVWKNGTPEWVEGNGLYLHTIVFDVGLSQTFTIRLISDSATACAKDATSGNFGIDGATFINRANMDNIVLEPVTANTFASTIHQFDSSTGAFTTAVTLVDVTSDTVTPIG